MIESSPAALCALKADVPQTTHLRTIPASNQCQTDNDAIGYGGVLKEALLYVNMRNPLVLNELLPERYLGTNRLRGIDSRTIRFT